MKLQHVRLIWLLFLIMVQDIIYLSALLIYIYMHFHNVLIIYLFTEINSQVSNATLLNIFLFIDIIINIVIKFL